MKKEKKESALRLMEALSGVDEELLERCEQSECSSSSISELQPGKKIYKWMHRYGGLCAACLCLMVLGAAYFTMEQQKSSSTDSAQPQMECAEDVITTDEDAGIDHLDLQMSGSSGNVDEITEEITEEAATKENFQYDRNEQQTENMTEKEISWEAACSTEILGAYVPVHIPEGYQPLKAIREMGEDGSVKLLLIWTNGQHQLSVKLNPIDNGEKQEEAAGIFAVYAGENWERKIPEPEEDGSTCFVLFYETGVSAEYKGWLTGDEIKNLLEPAGE